MLSIKQGGINNHFWVFGYDSTRNWTPVSQAISNANDGGYGSILLRKQYLKLYTNNE